MTSNFYYFHVTCICQRDWNGDLLSAGYPQILEVFAEIRETCPAINKVFVPDSEWARFREFAAGELVTGAHKPSLFLALKRGYLTRITLPIHRYLIEDGRTKTELTNQYRSDLIEKWMYAPDALERQRQARMFMGRLTELQCAEWIEGQSWRITGLEALGGQTDILAVSPEGQPSGLEVKYAGQEDSAFASFLMALEDGHSMGATCLYSATDFLLAKIYEAAIQLNRTDSYRIAVVAIASETLYSFLAQIQNNWIDWRTPSFFNFADFRDFYQRLRNRYPDIERDLPATIHSLNEVWFLIKWNDPARPPFEFLLRKDELADL